MDLKGHAGVSGFGNLELGTGMVTVMCRQSRARHDTFAAVSNRIVSLPCDASKSVPLLIALVSEGTES